MITQLFNTKKNYRRQTSVQAKKCGKKVLNGKLVG